MNLEALVLHIDGSLDDGTRLHLGDFGIGIAQAAAAVTKHGIDLLEACNYMLDVVERDTQLLCKLFLGGCVLRHKLVQWRVEKANCDFIATHGLKHAFEVATLQR